MDKRPLKVFLCHASADKPKVRELYRALKRRGVQPWLDAEDLIPGQNWEVEIPKALLSSDAIIICLTPNSVDKEGYVQKEIKFALDKAMEMPEGRIFIIPARLEECELPFSLKKYQAVNLFEKDGYPKLMRALKLRASQLERATVQLPKVGETTDEIKKVVEEKKFPEPKEEEPEIKTPKPPQEKVGVGGDVKESVIVSGSGNVINFGHRETTAPEKSQPKKAASPRKSNTAVIVALIGLVGTLFAALISSPILANLFSPASKPTATLSAPTNTKTPAPSKTPTRAITPNTALTPTATPYPTQITDAKGVSMVLVPASEFNMGSDKGNYDEKPVHNVYLDSFYIDKFEVTNILYKACVNAGKCYSPSKSSIPNHSNYYIDPEFADYPVVYVEHDDAQMYCVWRGAQLPTEAQWEKAARGTDQRTYPWGEGIDCSHANYMGCVNDFTAVGNYPSGVSPYGVFDMAGNVWEWVSDLYKASYYSTLPPLVNNPLGPEWDNSIWCTIGPTSGTCYSMRGGSQTDFAEDLRSANRGKAIVESYIVGFRCARSVP